MTLTSRRPIPVYYESLQGVHFVPKVRFIYDDGKGPRLGSCRHPRSPEVHIQASALQDTDNFALRV